MKVILIHYDRDKNEIVRTTIPNVDNIYVNINNVAKAPIHIIFKDPIVSFNYNNISFQVVRFESNKIKAINVFDVYDIDISNDDYVDDIVDLDLDKYLSEIK